MRFLILLLLLLAPMRALAAVHLASAADYIQAPVNSAFTIGNASYGNSGVQVPQYLTATANAGQAVLAVQSVTQLYPLMLVPASAYYPATYIASISGNNVTLGTNLTTAITAIGAATPILFGTGLPGWYRCVIARTTTTQTYSPVFFSSGNGGVTVANGMTMQGSSTNASSLNPWVEASSGAPFPGTGNDFSASWSDGQWRMFCFQSEVNQNYVSNGLVYDAIIRIYTAPIGGAGGGGVRLTGGAITANLSPVTSVAGLEFGGVPTVAASGCICDFYRAFGGQGTLTKAQLSAIAQGASPAAVASSAGMPPLDYYYDWSLATNSQTAGNSISNGATIADQSAHANSATVTSTAATWVADPPLPANQLGLNEPALVSAIKPTGNPIALSGNYTGTAPASVSAQVEYYGGILQAMGVNGTGQNYIDFYNAIGAVPGMMVALPTYTSMSSPPTIASISQAQTMYSNATSAASQPNLNVPSTVGLVVNQRFYRTADSTYYTITAINSSTQVAVTPNLVSAVALNTAIAWGATVTLSGGSLTGNLGGNSWFPIAGGTPKRSLASGTSGSNVITITTNGALVIGSAGDYVTPIPGIIPAGCYVSATAATSATLLTLATGAACNLTGTLTAGTSVEFGAGQVYGAPSGAWSGTTAGNAAANSWQALTSQTIGAGQWSGTFANVALNGTGGGLVSAQMLVRAEVTATPTEIAEPNQQAVNVGYAVGLAGQSVIARLGSSPAQIGASPVSYAPWTYLAYNGSFCNASVQNPTYGSTSGETGIIALENELQAAFPYVGFQLIPTYVGGTGMLPASALWYATAAGSGNVIGSNTLTAASASGTNVFGQSTGLGAANQFPVTPGQFVAGTQASATSGVVTTLTQGLAGTIAAGATFPVQNAYWTDNSQPNTLWAETVKAIALCGGDVNVEAWEQGENEMGGGLLAGQYATALQTLKTQLMAVTGRTANQIAWLAGAPGPDYADFDAYAAIVRQDVLAYQLSTLPWSTLDSYNPALSVNSAEVHPAPGPATIQMGIFYGQTIAASLGYPMARGFGPTLHRATVRGSAIRIYARHEGGNSLSLYNPATNGQINAGSTPDGISVTEQYGTAAAVTDPIIGYTIGANFIDLYLAHGPSGRVRVGLYMTASISPRTVLGTNPMSFTSGSTLVSINAAAHGLNAGDYFGIDAGTVSTTYLTATNFANVAGIYQVVSVTDANDFTFNMLTPALATGTSGSAVAIRRNNLIMDNSVNPLASAVVYSPIGLGQTPLPAFLTPANANEPIRSMRRRAA